MEKPVFLKLTKGWIVDSLLLTTCFVACHAWPQAQISTQAVISQGNPNVARANGIYVDVPKVYDEAALQALLSSVQKNLASLNAFNSTNLTNALGTLQGAEANQTLSAAQFSTGGTTPTVPSAPTTPAFSLPTAFSPSSADVFSEESQLAFQILSLQLLLQGARSDQVTPNTNLPRTLVTLGFPISINVPQGYEYQNAAAEIEVSVCAPGDTQSESKTPSVVTILPQEKTYNVAGIVNKSTQVSGGAIAQIFNFGGSFLKGHQTYFLMQDQDTIAFQRSPDGTCNPTTGGNGFSAASYKPVTFGWQFKPVLGEKVVRDGLRQVYAQLSFEPGDEGEIWCDRSINIRTRWRAYDKKTGRVGAPITNFTDFPATEANFNNPPIPSEVVVTDDGDGTVTVKASGNFKVGTYVRIGNALLGASPSVTPVSASPGSPATTSPSPAAPPTNTTQTSSPTAGSPATGGSGPPSTTTTANNLNATASLAPANLAGQSGNAVPSAANSAGNATTLQLQATLQLPSANQGGNSASNQQNAPTTTQNASAASVGSTQFLSTPGYILFSGPASSIALNGAYLVDPDGLEAPVIAAPYKNQTCKVSSNFASKGEDLPVKRPFWSKNHRVVKTQDSTHSKLVERAQSRNIKRGDPNESPANADISEQDNSEIPAAPADLGLSNTPNDGQGKAGDGGGGALEQSDASASSNDQSKSLLPSSAAPQSLPNALKKETERFNYFSDALLQAVRTPSNELSVQRYSDSLSLLTLSKVPDFSGSPNVPIVLIGSSVFGLRDQPFLRHDQQSATLLVPNSLLKDEVKTRDQVVWMQLFAPSPTLKVYRIPRSSDNNNQAVSVCNLSSTLSPIFLTSGNTRSSYAIFGAQLDALLVVGPTDVKFEDLPIDQKSLPLSIRILSIPNAMSKNGPSIPLLCGTVPVVISLPSPPGSAAGNSKEVVTPPTGGVTLHARSVQVSGQGLDHVVQILYGGKSLQFLPAPPSDGTALTIVNLAPNDPFNPTSSIGSKTLLFIFADQTSQTYSFKVQ